MWILKPLEPGGETHYLLPTQVYVVGRKNCDVLLSNDQSISRAHAHLTANEQTLSVKDASKYGTFVNNSRLPENQPLILKSGDNVTFGVFHSKFSVEHQEVVVCSSCLDNSEKTLLSDALQPLGGRLVNSWTQDCTHLVMSSVKVTIKTICALLCGRLIVKREYFTEFSKALRQRLPPPEAESFIPEIDEPSLNKEEVNLCSNQERGRLFRGKKFVFFNSKQLKRLSAAVSFGGGESLLLVEGSLPRPLLASPQSCVVDAASGSSQLLLPCSTAGWVDSVKRILHESGCRLITESEIGLAAIYVSCDKYCNPSIAFSDSDSVQSIRPRLPPYASLSQNIAIEETVLQASSINITAYVGNTESSQGLGMNDAAGMETVGETQKKSQHSRTNPLCESRPKAQGAGNVSTIADTMSGSFSTVENSGSQRQEAGPKQQGAKNVLPSNQMTNIGVGAFSQKRSSQKQKPPAQGSPQKQATLTNFFQPVNKKRPRVDEFSAEESEPKRTLQPSASLSSTTPAPTAAQAQSQPGSGFDLFTRPPDTQARAGRVSHPCQQGTLGRKRKELEEVEDKELEKVEEKADDMDMEELESIMSLEMDEFGEPSSAPPDQQAQLVANRSVHRRKPSSTAAVERPSTSKRPRVDPRGSGGSNPVPSGGSNPVPSGGSNPVPSGGSNPVPSGGSNPVPSGGSNPVPSGGLLEVSTCATSTTTQSLEAEERTSSIMRHKPLATADHAGVELWPHGSPEEAPADSRSQDALAVKDEDVSVLVDGSEALGGAAHGQPMKMLEKPLKVFKQDTIASEAEEDLPKRLVLVEFKSLTVTAPPRGKPQKIQGPSFTKNFKCFRKVRGSCAEGLPRVIRGGDLLAHNRGKNSELDEWLKDAAEEERQSKQEESLGDDLFRYNPSRLSKKR